MHHPYLLAALAEDRRRLCPCGAVAERPGALCRKCSARIAWRRKTTWTSRRTTRRRPVRERCLSLLRGIAKGAED